MPLVSIQQAVDLLLADKVVVFPTETVYGLGGLAESAVAIAKIFAIKKRPADNPLICHFHSLEQILAYTEKIPSYLPLLVTKLTPGPVTFLLPIPKDSPLQNATCGQKQVCCRIPKHPLALELLRKVGKPLVGPSANLSGMPSGTSASMVLQTLDSLVDGILDGGLSDLGLESTILDCRQEKQITILRPGVVGKVELLEILAENFPQVSVLDYKQKTNTQEQTVIPGQKYRHYSPQTPVYKIRLSSQNWSAASFWSLLSAKLQEYQTDTSIAILASTEVLQKVRAACPFTQQDQWLEPTLENSESKTDFSRLFYLNLGLQLPQISRQLYQALFKLDTLKLKCAFLLQENFGDSSLALALDNRLEKIGEVLASL